MKDFIPEENTYRKVILYGTTVGGELLYHELQCQGIHVLCFCDEYSERKTFCSIPVIKIDGLASHPDVPVILAVARSLRSVYTALKGRRVSNPVFTAKHISTHISCTKYIAAEMAARADAFVAQYPMYVDALNDTKFRFPVIEVFITEKCSLRCKYCSHMIPSYTAPKNYDVSMIISSLERLMEKIWFEELVILGGEPFLHPDLGVLLNWCIENRTHFKILSILTNGTVLPTSPILKLMRQAGARVRISDYGPLSAKMNELQAVCHNESVSCWVLHEKWTDFGHGEVHQYPEHELRKMFQACPFSQDVLLLGNRLYRCAHGAHLYNQNVIPMCKRDYLDPFDMDLDAGLKKFFDLQYLNACRFCNGPHFDMLLEPAEQLR